MALGWSQYIQSLYSAPVDGRCAEFGGDEGADDRAEFHVLQNEVTPEEWRQFFIFMAEECGIWQIDLQHNCQVFRCDLDADTLAGWRVPGKSHLQIKFCRKSGRFHLCQPERYSCPWVLPGSVTSARDRSQSDAESFWTERRFCLFSGMLVESAFAPQDRMQDVDWIRSGGDPEDVFTLGENETLFELEEFFMQEFDTKDEDDQQNKKNAEDDTEGVRRPKRKREEDTGTLLIDDPFPQKQHPLSSRASALTNMENTTKAPLRFARTISPRYQAQIRLCKDALKRRHVLMRKVYDKDEATRLARSRWIETSRTWPSVPLILNVDNIRADGESYEMAADRLALIASKCGNEGSVAPTMGYVAPITPRSMDMCNDWAGTYFYDLQNAPFGMPRVPAVVADYYWCDTTPFLKNVIKSHIPKILDTNPSIMSITKAPSLRLALSERSAMYAEAHTPSKCLCVNASTDWYRHVWSANRIRPRWADLQPWMLRCVNAWRDSNERRDRLLFETQQFILLATVTMSYYPDALARNADRESDGALKSHARAVGWWEVCTQAALCGAGYEKFFERSGRHRRRPFSSLEYDNTRETLAMEILLRFVFVRATQHLSEAVMSAYWTDGLHDMAHMRLGIPTELNANDFSTKPQKYADGLIANLDQKLISTSLSSLQIA